jgi:hypothetical protein
VSADKTSGSCTAIPAGSCNGNCGASSDDQCFCDQVCTQLCVRHANRVPGH